MISANISGNIDGICYGQQSNQTDREPAWKQQAYIGSQPFTRHPTDAGRQHLNAYHQRRGQ